MKLSVFFGCVRVSTLHDDVVGTCVASWLVSHHWRRPPKSVREYKYFTRLVEEIKQNWFDASLTSLRTN